MQTHFGVFEALVKVVESIIRVGRLRADPDEVGKWVKLYLMAYSNLYGEAWLLIKHHFLHHFSSHLRKWGKIGLPNCFCLERKHKGVKRFSNNLTSLQADFDANVLRDVTCLHLHRLSQPGLFSGVACLQDPVEPPRKMLEHLQGMFGTEVTYHVALSARANEWEVVHKGDVVVARGGDGKHFVGLVVQHAALSYEKESATLTLLKTMAFVRDVTDRCSEHMQGPLLWVRVQSIVCSTVFAEGNPYRILRPVHVEPCW